MKKVDHLYFALFRIRPARVIALAFLGATLFVMSPTIWAQHFDRANKSEAPYNLPFGPELFAPSQAATASGHFISADSFIPASFCAQCHKDVHRQWRESAHANSFRAPFYLRNVEMLIQQKGIEATRHCESCHNPVALFSGALTSGSKLPRTFDDEGVTCTVCHSIQAVRSTSGTGSYVIGKPAVLLSADGKAVSMPVSGNDILTNLEDHKRAVMRSFYRTPEFCAVCHKSAVPKAVNDYRWLRALSVYDEWQESSWSKQSLAPFYTKAESKTCQNCHMGPESAPDDYAGKNGAVSSHRWLGANTAIPEFYHYPAQAEKTREFLKSAIKIDIFGISKGNGALIAPLETQRFMLMPGDDVTLNVVLQNSGVGHSLVPEQRDFYESWVELRVKDASGKTICRSGELQKDGSLDPDAHTYTNRLVDRSGKWLDLHQIWDARIRAYDNTIMPGRSDLVRYRFRIPPGGKGDLTVSVRLNYRRFRKSYTDFVLKDKPLYPVTEMSSRTVKLHIGDNAPVSSDIGIPEYLRWNNYGIALLGEIQYYKAAEAFRKVVELNPQYVDGYTNVAIASYTELLDHKREGADGLGENGLAAGGMPDGSGNLFLSRGLDETFDPASKALNEALARDPSNLRAQFHKAVVNRVLKRFDLAIDLMKPVVAAYPRFRQARQELGYSYFVTKQYELAREQFEALQSINPDDITANNYLSYVYERLGMKDKAAEQARLFNERKEDVEVEPIAQLFWTNNPSVASELAPFHVHEVKLLPDDLKTATRR